MTEVRVTLVLDRHLYSKLREWHGASFKDAAMQGRYSDIPTFEEWLVAFIKAGMEAQEEGHWV